LQPKDWLELNPSPPTPNAQTLELTCQFLGRAMAEALAEHGAQVMISSRKLEECRAAAEAINVNGVVRSTSRAT
jgi:hypothetical protein